MQPLVKRWRDDIAKLSAEQQDSYALSIEVLSSWPIFHEIYGGPNLDAVMAMLRRQPLADPVNGEAYSDPVTGMQFVRVIGDYFQMGDVFEDGEKNERPVHEVKVDNFYMGVFLVTQSQWKAVMNNNPAHFRDYGNNCPVENVNWNEVQIFIDELNRAAGKTYRLPTEAEWEYAARSGGENQKWAGTSMEAELSLYAHYDDNSKGQIHPVGQKRPNGLGLYDMSGNVWEWVEDWYARDYYASSSNVNPSGPNEGETRVLRGGSRYSDAKSLRTSYRSHNHPDYKYSNIGFRLVF